MKDTQDPPPSFATFLDKAIGSLTGAWQLHQQVIVVARARELNIKSDQLITGQG